MEIANTNLGWYHPYADMLKTHSLVVLIVTRRQETSMVIPWRHTAGANLPLVVEICLIPPDMVYSLNSLNGAVKRINGVL